MAYVNTSINQGGEGTFLASTAISLYQRLTFVTGTSGDGKPSLAVATNLDRAVAVAMQPIASGAYGTVRFLNAPGEQFGLASGTIALGATVYAAAAGKLSTVATSSNIVGIATSAGFDGGPFTYIQHVAAA